MIYVYQAVVILSAVTVILLIFNLFLFQQIRSLKVEHQALYQLLKKRTQRKKHNKSNEFIAEK